MHAAPCFLARNDDSGDSAARIAAARQSKYMPPTCARCHAHPACIIEHDSPHCARCSNAWSEILTAELEANAPVTATSGMSHHAARRLQSGLSTEGDHMQTRSLLILVGGFTIFCFIMGMKILAAICSLV